MIVYFLNRWSYNISENAEEKREGRRVWFILDKFQVHVLAYNAFSISVWVPCCSEPCNSEYCNQPSETQLLKISTHKILESRALLNTEIKNYCWRISRHLKFISGFIKYVRHTKTNNTITKPVLFLLSKAYIFNID